MNDTKSERIRIIGWRYRYLVALGAVALACLIKHFGSSNFWHESPFLIFSTAIVFAAWMGGLRAGLFATVLASLIASYFFLPPYNSFMIADSNQSIRLVSFALEGILVSVLFQSLHRSRERARKAMDDAEESRRVAEQANQAKKDFIANMSHEIRTPLTAVLGFTELVLNPGIDPVEKEKFALKMRANASALSHLIDDILDISSIERGGLQIHKENVDMKDLFTSLDAELKSVVEDKGLRLEFRSKGPIPSHIDTDERKLRQILLHVVGNAIKFTNKGSVLVSVTYKKRSSRLAILVKDQGIGIASEQVRSLFKPFNQADTSTTRRFGGTGLGLSLARKLAKSLGGDIQLLGSQLGEGSTFLITVAAGEFAPLNMIPNFSISDQTSAINLQTQLPTLNGIKVLLVEDSPDTCMLVSRLLRMAGAAVDTADNGREGVTKAELGDYNVILMDIQMPVMDGNQAAKELRQHHYTKPIIALSAHAMKEDKDEALRSGFNDYLLKPVNRLDLVSKIRSYGAVML